MGGRLSAIQMQKYLFLYTKLGGEKIYDFVPYRYGCFSFQANKDILSLSNDQLVSVGKDNGKDVSYQLNYKTNALESLDLFTQDTIGRLHRDFGSMSQRELIIYTYKHWPFTAINSVIKEELLDKNNLQKVLIQKNRFLHTDSTLFTIGYEGFSLEIFLRQLITNDVKVLCDVRKNAISRKYGFSKSTLEKACQGVSIRYVHIPELGIASSFRQTLKCQEDYDRLFDLYEGTTLKEGDRYLQIIRGLLSSDKRVCLMCFEKDPRQCHRTRIAKALMSLANNNWEYREILL